MSKSFIFIQLLGFVAWLFLILSYHRQTTNKILIFQIISVLFYGLHYYLLKAYSGLAICLFEALINFLYYKTDKDKYIFLATIPLYLILGFLTFSTIINILPIIASLIDSYSLTKHKNLLVIGSIISHLLWIIYDLFVMSYAGALTDTLLVISNIFVLIFECRPRTKTNLHLK